MTPSAPPPTQPDSTGSDGVAVAGTVAAVLDRRTLRDEAILVLLVSLAASGIRALLNLVESLTRQESLASQSVGIVVSRTPDRPWLDLAYQLVGIGLALVPVLLVAHLLRRSGEGLRGIGFDATQPGRDVARGAVLAVLVGGTGLALYLASYAAGGSLRVVPASLPEVWWALPVLLLAALENAVLEEVVVLGYLLHRLRQIGVGPVAAVAISAVVRGSYHLYQGFGGFLGNTAMGVLFGVLFLRWRRTAPFVIAHFLIDAVAFVGYQYLRGRVGWLP